MTGLREELDRALRSVPAGEAPVRRAMREGRRRRIRRRVAVLAGALAIAAAAAVSPSLARGTASAPPAPATGGTATPAATQTLADGDPVITDGTAGTTEGPDGLTDRTGLIAQGAMGAVWWQLSVRGPGKANPVPADSCYTVAQAAGSSASSLHNANSGSCLDLPSILAAEVSAGDPAAFDERSFGPTVVTVGEAAGDVTYFIVTFTDGQQLKLLPVTTGGHRYLGWIAPERMAVASVVAHLGGPYSDSGQAATAVPFDQPGQLPAYRLWQEPGQAAPPRAQGVIGRGMAGGRAWSVSAYEGPWGTCFVPYPGSSYCMQIARLTATGVLGGWGGSTPGPAFGSAAPGVELIRVTLSNGKSVQVTPVTVGDERLFAFWIGAGVSPTGWTAYDAAGRVVGTASMTTGSATGSVPLG
jgi:hypothetical protein